MWQFTRGYLPQKDTHSDSSFPYTTVTNNRSDNSDGWVSFFPVMAHAFSDTTIWIPFGEGIHPPSKAKGNQMVHLTDDPQRMVLKNGVDVFPGN